MVATEPLPAQVWDQIGLAEREVFTDHRHVIIYGQRTADDRLAFGGRGAPYHFGSRIRPEFDHDADGFRRPARDADRPAPAARAASSSPTPGAGRSASPATGTPSVGHDPATGLGWAGGYVGDGVAATNLAGRTLADLVTGRAHRLTELPWVGHRSRRWEPEPAPLAGRSTPACGWPTPPTARRPAPAARPGSAACSRRSPATERGDPHRLADSSVSTATRRPVPRRPRVRHRPPPGDPHHPAP